MKQAIHYSCDLHQYLSTTPRKKNGCHTLYILESGTALIRLGKLEHILSAGDAFWIPFDCLYALSILPNSKLTTVNFSVRLTDPFPSETGYVVPSKLMTALCNRLEQLDETGTQFQRDLLQVLRHDVSACTPVLKTKQNTIVLSQWIQSLPAETTSLTLSGLSLSPSELTLVIKVRESIKMRKSGVTTNQVVGALFGGDNEAYLQSMKCALGEWE